MPFLRHLVKATATGMDTFWYIPATLSRVRERSARVFVSGCVCEGVCVWVCLEVSVWARLSLMSSCKGEYLATWEKGGYVPMEKAREWLKRSAIVCVWVCFLERGRKRERERERGKERKRERGWVCVRENWKAFEVGGKDDVGETELSRGRCFFLNVQQPAGGGGHHALHALRHRHHAGKAL